MSNSRPRILHLISQRPESTGSGIYIQAMLRGCAVRNHPSFLLAGIPRDVEPALSCISPAQCSYVRFNSADLPYPVVGMSDVMPYPSTRFSDLSEEDLSLYEGSFARQMKDAVGRFAPDLIHTHHLWLVTALARRLFPGLPIVASCHGSDLRQFKSCPHFAEKVAADCQQLDAVLALSRSQKAEIEDLYRISGEKIRVAGAGFNETLFYPDCKPPPAPVQLIYAGKLSRSKGLPWLLRALSGVAPDWRLHLIGDGSGQERDECLALARQLGERAVIYGSLGQESLAQIMRRSHLFILPSFFEGLPLVLIEALASGCRLVSTALPGVVEVMGDTSASDLRLIRPPRLQDVDKPVEADLPLFEGALRTAIEEQIAVIQREPAIDLQLIRSRVSGFKWSRVFDRVEPVYRALAG